MGRALTADEISRLNGWLIEAVELAIDQYVGRGWLGGTVTAERYELGGPVVYLKQRPVTAITAVAGKDYLDASTRVLTAGTDYAADLTTGRLIIGDGVWPSALSGYDYLEVSYTVPATVPANVTEAATLLAAAWLGSASASGSGAASGIKRWSTDGQSIEYRDAMAATAGQSLPSTVVALLPVPRPAFA